eukprot:9428301-Prorocentrum_lima.AAC.1
MPMPPGASKLENLLRVDLLTCIPKDISDNCTLYACQTSIELLTRTTRGVMPTKDLSRMSLAQELQATSTRVPSSMN